MVGADHRPAFADAQATFGVPALVTRPAPDDAPIMTTIVWQPPIPTEVGFDAQGLNTKRLMALSLADVQKVPRGTLVHAPEVLNGEIKNWLVDGFDRYEFDAIRVYVALEE